MTIEGDVWGFYIGMGIFAAVAIGFIFFGIIKLFIWKKNNITPLQSRKAMIISKRIGNRVVNGVPVKFATFQLDDGRRKEFRVSPSEWKRLAEGWVGMLSFKGSRYEVFTRDSAQRRKRS